MDRNDKIIISFLILAFLTMSIVVIPPLQSEYDKFIEKRNTEYTGIITDKIKTWESKLFGGFYEYYFEIDNYTYIEIEKFEYFHYKIGQNYTYTFGQVVVEI